MQLAILFYGTILFAFGSELIAGLIKNVSLDVSLDCTDVVI